MTSCEVDGYQLVFEIRCLQFPVHLATRLQESVPSTTLAHNLPFCDLRDSPGCIFVHLGRIFVLYLKSENFQTLLCWVTSDVSRRFLKLETVGDVCVNRGEVFKKFLITSFLNSAGSE